MGYGVTSMTYDANGNMTSDSSAGSTLTYDFENSLASYATALTTASYLYSPSGRRLQKTVNSVVTRYLWDGAMMIAELDETNQIQRIYTYNPQSMEPVSTAIGCTAYFYITDHLMTPQMLTNISGTTAWYAELSAFGTANVITSTVQNNLRFPGQYEDTESGLHYNYARYYMPEAGRYLQPDLINVTTLLIFQKALAANLSYLTYGLEPYESYPVDLLYKLLLKPQSQNMYPYVDNNTLIYIDPKGQITPTQVIAGLVIAGIILKWFYPPDNDVHLPTNGSGTAEPSGGEGNLPNACQETPLVPIPQFPIGLPPGFSNGDNSARSGSSREGNRGAEGEGDEGGEDAGY
jgi:RHS repeat-associated protein